MTIVYPGRQSEQNALGGFSPAVKGGQLPSCRAHVTFPRLVQKSHDGHDRHFNIEMGLLAWSLQMVNCFPAQLVSAARSGSYLFEDIAI
jgi:hypothetical protein